MSEDLYELGFRGTQRLFLYNKYIRYLIVSEALCKFFNNRKL